jgi:hypothetical protein
MTYGQYLERVMVVMASNPSWRQGQTMFNVLWEVNPALAERVRGSLVDPFYSEAIIPEFLAHVERCW